MVKNYISAGILLIGLLFSFNNSYSQAVEFKGERTDFDESQKITGDPTVDYYVSFSETTLYFGAFRSDGGNFASTDNFTIYLDTDPEPGLTTGTGSTTGHLQNGYTPTLPFSANDRITIRHNANNTTTAAHHKNVAPNWVQQSNQTIRFSSPTALEIAIPKSRLTDDKGVYFSMFISRFDVDGFYGYNSSTYPINVEDTTNITGYFGGIGLISEVSNPTTIANIPIMHTLPSGIENENVRIISGGGKYAYMEFGNASSVVTGDIELVAGGTASITAASALTVEGNFTNNGLVTLSSTAFSYSSLIPGSMTGNGIVQYHRHVNAAVSDLGNNDLITTPLTGQSFGNFASANPNIISNPNNLSQRGFGPFSKSEGKYLVYDTDSEDANIILTPGIGYRTASKIVAPSDTGGPFTFTGKVITDVVEIPITTNSNDFAIWNLIGNPYPSYVKLYDLITDNLTKFDENYLGVYAYVGLSGQQGIWEAKNQVNSGELAMAPGQGFFVSSKSAAEVFTFSPSLRTAGFASDFLTPVDRVSAPIDNVSLRLKISNSSTTTTPYTDIYFHTAGTLDFDLGYDSGQLGNPSFSIFSKLVEDADNRDIPLTIQTLPHSILDSEVSVPIGIKALQGEQITISAINTPNPLPLPETVEVYFEDNVTNTSTLLSTSPFPHTHHYIFTPSTNLTGEMDRFSLRFTNKSLSISNPDFDALNVYSPLNSGNLIVRGTINEVTRLEVYDLNGRLLHTFSVQPNQSENRFEVSNLATGIYIVKLNNKTQSKIKKIQLSNKL